MQVCESSFFSLINTHEAVFNHLGCNVTHTLQEKYLFPLDCYTILCNIRYADYAPAIAVATDRPIEHGQCVITDIRRLLGCPGQSSHSLFCYLIFFFLKDIRKILEGYVHAELLFLVK